MIKKLSTYFKTFLAAMLLLAGSNYVGATDWSSFASSNAATNLTVSAEGESYYLFNVGTKKFVGVNPSLITSPTSSTNEINLSGTSERDEAHKFILTGTSLESVTITAAEHYLDKTSWYFWDGVDAFRTGTSQVTFSIEAVANSTNKYLIKIHSNDYHYDGRYMKMYNASMQYGVLDNNDNFKWYLIPAASLEGNCSVTSKNSDGTITVNTNPTATVSSSVKFNVSGAGTISCFNFTKDNNNFIIGVPTRSGDVITVPVSYTAHNNHSGTETPAETATITITANNSGATTASATVDAYVDLQPTFSRAVIELDWNRVNNQIVEYFYPGMDVAASERDRLSNKLVVTGANTMAQRTTATKTTWTATIIGTNANQFKFLNGTQSTSGFYNDLPGLIDVHYAPTVAGEHTATLRIVASYTDGNSKILADTNYIALSGRCEGGSIITFAADGNQSPSNTESYPFGEIIGTNQREVTAELLISQITNRQKVWYDPDGAFEFDVNSVNLNQTKQTLTFRAHHETPVEVSTPHTATLTISGKGTENEDVSAILTLTYTALPLANRQVTWNWDTIRENVTLNNNPFVTDFDTTWTLIKTAGDKITYDNVAHTITADYLHHEPAQAAAFILQIPQTATYAAFEEEYETVIDVTKAPVIHITANEFGDENFVTQEQDNFFADEATFDSETNTLTTGKDNEVIFKLSGQTAMTFSYHGEDFQNQYVHWIPTWTIKEYYSSTDAGTIVAEGYHFPEGDTIWGISSNAVKFSLTQTQSDTYGEFKDITFFEYDTIQPEYYPAPLINNGGTINPTIMPVTIANKRQVTVTLNETAAQYFTLTEGASAPVAPAAPTAPTIELTETVFNNSDSVAYEDGFWDSSASFSSADNKLSISSWIEFLNLSGQNRISFHYVDGRFGNNTTDPKWIFKEYVDDAWHVIGNENKDLNSDENKTWSFSPTATKIRIEQTGEDAWGDFTNVRIYEYVEPSAPSAATIELTEEVMNSSLVEYEDGWFDSSASFDGGDNKLMIYSWIEFTTAGQNRISFHYEDGGMGSPTDPKWIFKEYVNGAWNVIGDENVDLPSNQDTTVWSFSPTATKIRIEQTHYDCWGDFTNVSLYTEAPAVVPVASEPVSSIVFDDEDGLGLSKIQNKSITLALKSGVTTSQAIAATAGNACQIIFEDDYTYNHEVQVLPIVIIAPSEITYKHSEHGSYMFTYKNNGFERTVTNEDSIKSIDSTDPADYVVTLSAPNPAEGYAFQGWKVKNEIVSYRKTFTTSITAIDSEVPIVVEAVFAPVEGRYFQVEDAFFDDLNEAINATQTTWDRVVTVADDVTLETGSYTIPAGVTLLIPHKANFYKLQETPDLVNVNSNELELAQKLSAYRTLTLKGDATITCNGTICVAGNMVTANGGRKSAYPTGEVGMINMVHGGYIELNNGSNLYCWGYIKGQDMDQGNNTVGTGTVTANAGSTIWEDFELGDWRGGTASFNIYLNNEDEHRQLFPFQSYAIQNIEIPTTFKYGSLLRTYTCISTGLGNHGAVFSMIGSGECMFKLQDANSEVRTWYDATTDLTCYELSGSAKLDQLSITVYVSMSSKDFILPISNSMHIILASDLDLVNPLMAQAGSIIEIKPTATVNLTSDLYLYDKDEWGLYIHNYYFRSFNNITSHKNRGAENSKAGLDDAKLIVDGTFNIQNGGKLYTTAGGANIMGNNGGVINFNAALPTTPKDLWYVTVLGQAPYIKWGSHPVKAANLCNEDGSYTRSMGGGYTFHNVHGRWFVEGNHEEQADHTYAFTYMQGGNTGTEDEGTAAVYSHDKTGLEARMKWFNVEPDLDCSPNPDADVPTADWWKDASDRYYNYSMLNEWHQFIETNTANQYSGSNNSLYQKNGCTWIEEGAVDENCLYTIGGVKKALVNGEFIPLESNGYDPAYHATANAGQYYICFTGCNWHPATKYDGESKAYTIHPEDEDLHYIWFNNDWLNVERDGSFFFTADEQTNVRTYYEYVNGDWVVATPYVSVTDDAETRNFYMIKEAFNVAQIKKNATITLLRDLTNVSEVLSFSTQNTTCTLDLNGHVLSGNIENMITVDAPGCTFTITDNSTLKNGKISTTQSKAVYAKKGTVVLNNGTIESTGAYAIEGAAAGSITINGGYLAAATQCVNGSSCTIYGGHFTTNAGLATYCAANKYPFETEDSKYRYEVSDAWVITFVDETTTLQTLHVKPGETPQYTAAQPTKADNKFTGWSPAIAAASQDQTYTAQFAAISEGEVCVTLNSNGGNEGLQYVYVTSGSAIGTLPAGTTKDGHTFAGWYDAANEGTQITTETVVSGPVTWYAHYTKNSYTLTWDANGGEIAGTAHTSGDVYYGDPITAPANANVTKAGHTFLGWNATPAATMPAHDVTYKAQWSILAKHYLQNIDGTYPETPEATDDVTGEAGAYVTPATKTYDGFITPATQTVQIGVATEVTYNYVRRTYTITWDANGGTCVTASTDVKHGATATLPEATWTNHRFDGWFTKAVGGDQITASTVIQRNIGTLYAHWTSMSEIIAGTSTDADARNIDVSTYGTDVTINTLFIEKDGMVTIPVGTTLSTTDFVLESTGYESGQLIATNEQITVTGNAYFDLKINAKNHKWYSVAVPWQVNAEGGISVNGRVLQFGKDFDILYYDGAARAANGANGSAWKYMEDTYAQGARILQPGTLYMIGLMMDAPTIRFQKAGGALLNTTTSVTAYSGSAAAADQGWNGIANPALFHAFVNTGVTAGQVYNPETNGYDPILMNGAKFVVGKSAFVQVSENKNPISVSYGGAYAPRRTRAEEATLYDVQIAPAEGNYTDRLFVRVEDDKADQYIIGQDLAKMGVSSIVPQLWINRYEAKLCMNTQALTNGLAEYPLLIYAPANGEYTISVLIPQGERLSQNSVFSDQYSVYLTLNGQAIWNLSESPYTLMLNKGTATNYGLRISARAPQTATGTDEAIIDAKGETKKVLINDQVYIIREGQIYSVDGRKVN